MELTEVFWTIFVATASALVFGLTKDWIEKSKEDLFAKAIKPTNI